LTFLGARVLVFLIMSHRIADIFVHIRGTHVHHLSLGIFLMSGAFAYLLFWHPSGRALHATEVLYGIALALTFDEFGMWLHLGGGYWQRASFDAVVVITGLLTLLAVGPSLRQFRRRHVVAAAVLLVSVLLFAALLAESLRHGSEPLTPALDRLERSAPR
jgi:hypothetical protein